MSDTPAANVSIETSGTAVIARVVAKLLEDKDLRALGKQVDESAAPGAVSVVVLDMSKVQFLPSLSLGILVQMSTKCRARQQKMKIAGLSPQLKEMFRITKMDRILELVDSVDSALEQPEIPQ